MSRLVVVNSAMLECTEGTEPSKLKLNATLECLVSLDGMQVASIFDNQPGINIRPFGNCHAKTKKKGHSCPCDMPETPSPWQPGERSILLPSLSPLLAQNGQLECAQGGIISIIDPGQGTLNVDNYQLSDLVELVSGLDLPGDAKGKILRLLKEEDDSKINLLYEIFRIRRARENAAEIFSGAHVIVRGDGGQILEELKKAGARSRSSSHHMMDDQVGLNLGTPYNHGHILGGRDKQSGDTRFQFEEHPTTSAKHLITPEEEYERRDFVLHVGSWVQKYTKHGDPQKGLFDLDSKRIDTDPISIG